MATQRQDVEQINVPLISFSVLEMILMSSFPFMRLPAPLGLSAWNWKYQISIQSIHLTLFFMNSFIYIKKNASNLSGAKPVNMKNSGESDGHSLLFPRSFMAEKLDGCLKYNLQHGLCLRILLGNMWS